MTPPLGASRLSDLPRHARGVVVAHATDPATAERLSALGLAVGASFTVMRSGARPTVLVGASRIGLGPELLLRGPRAAAMSGAPGDAAPPARPSATAAAVRLGDLARGARARVVSVGGAPGTAQRLLEMGLTVGTTVEVVRFAPLGDPLEVKVRGYRLSLRAAEASGVLVERLP